MSHLDDEAFASLALGDDADGTLREHVDSCERCGAEHAEFARTMGLVAESADVTLLNPPARVLTSIRSELGIARRRSGSRMPSGWRMGLVAAASALLGGLGVTAITGLGGEREGETLVAQADLTDLRTQGDGGSAQLVTREDGSQVIVLDLPSDEAGNAVLEVWMIDENVEGMVSLGHVSGLHSEFAVPAGLDFHDFPIIDVSVEPLDGVPTHSGDSIQRGTLSA